MTDAKVTSDAKHVEIGLTDKADGALGVRRSRGRGIAAGLVLIAGDEFGPLGGLPGPAPACARSPRATAVSVGAEPTGTPEAVLALGGGPARFMALLKDQLERRIRGDVPELDADPDWTLTAEGFDPQLERVHESLCRSRTAASAHEGARCSRILRPRREWWPQVSTRDTGRTPPWRFARMGKAVRRASVDPLLRRRLDLHTGLLRQDLALPEGALSVLQLSLTRPGTALLRAQGPESLLPEWIAHPARRALGGREQLAATSASIALSPTVWICRGSRTSPRSRGHRFRASARRAP